MSRSFYNAKDTVRAEELNRPRKGTHATPFEAAISNSAKMANLIKDPEKMLGRFEAIAMEHPHREIRQPFIDHILNMEARGEFRGLGIFGPTYKDAWTIGLYSGKHFPNGHTYDGDKVAQYIFETAYNIHRKVIIEKFRGRFGL